MTDLTPEEIVKALREVEHGAADRPIGSEEWAAHAYATAPKAADMIERMGKVLGEIADGPGIPSAYQWSGLDHLEDMFDPELRHKNGSKPIDYLKAWLSMLRPFAFATKDESWGEMEKLLCIVMRNYVRMADSRSRARAALAGKAGERGG